MIKRSKWVRSYSLSSGSPSRSFFGKGRGEVLNGTTNTVAASAPFSSVLNGNNNSVSGTYASVLGGACNAVSGNYSSVVGGGGGTSAGNTVSGNYSSILGGQCNTVTHNWASASGYGIVSAADCAFHANCIIVPNTPPFGGIFPAGTYVHKDFSLLAAGDKVVVMI